MPLTWTRLHAWHSLLLGCNFMLALISWVSWSVRDDGHTRLIFAASGGDSYGADSCSLGSLGFCRWLPPDLWTWSCCHFQIDTQGQKTVMRGEERLSSLLANIFGCWTSSFQLSGKNFGRNWHNFIVIGRFSIINSFFLKGRCWFHVRHWVDFENM